MHRCLKAGVMYGCIFDFGCVIYDKRDKVFDFDM